MYNHSNLRIFIVTTTSYLVPLEEKAHSISPQWLCTLPRQLSVPSHVWPSGQLHGLCQNVTKWAFDAIYLGLLSNIKPSKSSCVSTLSATLSRDTVLPNYMMEPKHEQLGPKRCQRPNADPDTHDSRTASPRATTSRTTMTTTQINNHHWNGRVH